MGPGLVHSPPTKGLKTPLARAQALCQERCRVDVARVRASALVPLTRVDPMTACTAGAGPVVIRRWLERMCERHTGAMFA